VTSSTLLQGLHQISLLKTVPEGLKPRECKRVKLCKPLPVPYVPTKNEVQDEVAIARMQSLKIKTTFKKDTTLNFVVWQENRTRKAFLMHVTAVLDAIKKRGHVKDYETAAKEYEGAKKAVESAKAGLALLDRTGEKGKKSRKKRPRKARRMPLRRPQNLSQTPRKPRFIRNPVLGYPIITSPYHNHKLPSGSHLWLQPKNLFCS
jgi:hypothetical protein